MQTARLNKGWEFFKGTLGGVWEIWRRGRMGGDYEIPWEPVELPHCYNAWDSVDPDTRYYQGEAWYCNQIIIDNPYPNGRTLLHFEGAGQKTEIYAGFEKVGSHLGGYDEFVVDLTDAVYKMKQNSDVALLQLAIRCDNSRDLETIPSDLSDFNLYGGIYRYINLVYIPAISLEKIQIELNRVSKLNAAGKIKVSLDNPTAYSGLCHMKLTLYDPDHQIINQMATRFTPGNASEAFHFEIDSPELWSPEAPQLYMCKIELNSELGRTELSERFGLRFFEFVKKGPFMLNGERILLKGTHRHEDHAGLGAAMTEDLIRREMKLIKDMGVNFIRLGHYQQSRIVLDLCDELGILVWEEIPWCRGGLGGAAYQSQAECMLTAMITQHYNHPSIIIWGLGNENDWPGDFTDFDQEAIRGFMAKLHRLSHTLDDSRVTAIRRCDFCKDIVDVYSPSIWAGWYRGTYPEYHEFTRKEFERVDRFLHVEWGADNLAGRHSETPYTGIGKIRADGGDERSGDYLLTGGEARISRDGDWSETYFCDLIDWHLHCQVGMDWLTGTAQWVFKDFSTPIRPENPIPYMNIKGVAERDLTLKESYYVFQSYWAKQPMIHILGHRMPVRWGEISEVKTVKVYSNCTSAELFLNEISCGIKYKNPDDFPASGLRWELQFQPGTNHLKVRGERDGCVVWDEIEFDYQTEKWGVPAGLDVAVRRRDNRQVILEVKAIDAAGVFCPDANNFIRFGLTGAGKLMDNLGTADGSRYRQLASGRAAININTRGGRSMASIAAEGMPTRFVLIE